MLNRADIVAVNWQLRSEPGRALFGEIATDLDDIEQAIRQAILTPKRSVPLDPEKGCDLIQYVDKPQVQQSVFVLAEVRRCLARDVPRIEVGAVRISAQSFEALTIEIEWRPLSEILAQFIVTQVDYVVI